MLGSTLAATAALLVIASCGAETSHGGSTKKHEHYMPLVAFQCGYRNKFMNKDGHWQDDPSSAASCLHGKYDVLKYCKRVYPDEQITNIVEYSHLTRVDRWCREDGTDCHHKFTVRPFRCIAGEFVTESLQVPQRCHFSHIAGKDKCNDYKFWSERADGECAKKKETESSNQTMRLRSFAILEPCGLGMFRGVEFVCCPKDLEERIEKVVDLEADKFKRQGEEDTDNEEDDEDDEEYSDEDEEEDEVDEKAESKKADTKAEQDPYFKEDAHANEHERFREAEERLEKRHRKKVTKVITEWSELFERYNKMKEKDPKGAEQYKRDMTAKFRKTVASLEAENKEQRKQIEELHDERVQTALNEKKRQATHEYRAALAVQVGQTNKQNVLRTLKNYIRAEEKDRQHMLNRYRHLLRSDPEAAVSFEPVLLHRLRYIDLRINGTLAMLRDFPELEKELRPVAITFWKTYRRENTPEVLEEDTQKEDASKGHYLSDEERNERLIRLYKQSFKRRHPGAHLALQLQEVAKAKADKAATTTAASVARKSMVVALKDVLKEKEDQPAEEDSDEDQFEEDEEGAVKATSTAATTTQVASLRMHVDPLQKKVVAAMPMRTDKKVAVAMPMRTEKETAAKKMKIAAESSASSESDSAEEEEEDEDEDVGDEADSEYVASNDKKAAAKGEEGAKKKHLRVNVEPIMLAPAGELIDEAVPAFGKHHRAFSRNRDNEDAQDNGPAFARWLAQTNLLLGLLALTFAVLAILVLLRRRRNRHPGFIEVDVCTPEERHVEGMQVNGYENPTYTFFEGKAAC